MSRIFNWLLLCCVAVLLFVGSPVFADGVSLADPGFQITDYFTAVATSLGTIVAGALGVTLIFWAMKRGLKWLRG